jgi:hypothetical protein
MLEVITKENHLTGLYAGLQREVNVGLEDLGGLIYDQAYAATHVVTGDMRRSLFIAVSAEGELIVGYGVDYAVDEELGNMYRPGHPALTPAFDHFATEAQVAEVVEHAIQRTIAQGF